ncbi:MAG TPA: hypothetical protein VEI06_10905 [Gemmatimonadaceae bacterium]|nr:hypothetical protein [Gemmatimonadaceae bacterium]
MRELLARLHNALPEVERWIEDLRTRHLLRSSRASDLAFPRLAASLPAELLGATRVAMVDRVPFPPVESYGLPEFKAMASRPMGGITFRDMYFVPSRTPEGVHFHELIHALQWKTLGVRPFLLTYALGIVQYGYEKSPLETVAYEFQGHFERRMAMPRLADDVATHAREALRDATAVARAHGLDLGA